MKKLLTFFITALTITASMHCAAIAKQFDTSTLPVLFYANQESYLAQTPWFNFTYQQRKIQLQTCKEEACIQRLQFLELQEGEQSHKQNNGSAFLGKADKVHTSNTYSKLRLGQSNHNTLHVSGNQRRILFSFEIAEKGTPLRFKFEDEQDSLISQEQHALVRSSKLCISKCETTWQAYSVDKEGQYTPITFHQQAQDQWVVKELDNTIRIELTALFGQYSAPLHQYHNEETSFSSYQVNSNAIINTLSHDQQNQYNFENTKVIGLSENTWLLQQDSTLQLTDNNAKIIKSRELSTWHVNKFISSYISKNQIYLLAQVSDKYLTPPSKQTVIAQYPKKKQNRMRPVVLYEFDLALNLISSTTLYLPESELPYAQITLQSWGVLVGTGEAAAASVNHTYQSNQSSANMANCPMINDGYGYGLLCWKALNNPTTNYTPSAASSMIPVTVVDNTTPNLLNQLEANQHGTIFDNSGTPVDPGGSWTHENNVAINKEDLGLSIAMYNERWNSPVAANIIFPAGSSSRPVMFRAVEYSAANTSNLPHNVCNQFAASSGYPEYQAADACMTQANFGLFSLESLKFDRWQGGIYHPDQSVSGNDNSWFPWFTNFVGDPPVEDVFTAEAVHEMVARMRINAANIGTLIQDSYIDGHFYTQAHVPGYYISYQ